MASSACAAAVGVVLLLAGCAERLVELPINREPAAPIALAKGAVRCPADTVLDTDDDPKSGAGAVPTDFNGRTVLRCEVDYVTMRSRAGVDYFPVSQWQRPLTPQLRAALDLPDRELRPRSACAGSFGSTNAVYLVDQQRRVVRVLLPWEDPCRKIRAEVAALLPAFGSPPDATFTVQRKR
jgi:hypothetical protein